MRTYTCFLFGFFWISCATAGSGPDEQPPPDPGVDAGSPDASTPAQGCGDVACDDAVFVDHNAGSDENDGSRDAPVATIRTGISLAESYTPPRAVLIASGVYEEEIGLSDGVSLYGGYAAFQGWVRDPALYPTEIHGDLRTVSASNIITPTRVDGLTISASAAMDYGESSIAVVVMNSTELTFSNVTILPGDGAAGEDGIDGMAGAPGAPGGEGEAGCENSDGFGCSSCSRPYGGAGGGSVCGMSGGAGGRPGLGGGVGDDGEPGAGGTSGGTGGTGGEYGHGQVGGTGASGDPGLDGMSGQRIGSFSPAGYTPSHGMDGEIGSPGNGGGGGGGGGGGDDRCDSYGSSGGGGGGGGCGGQAGSGGGGGGGSFGVILLDSTVAFEDCMIAAGVGGNGGAGGDGGDGGAGGDPGPGGPYGGDDEQDDGGMGAAGGRGGSGGRGGHGGGGGGGPSVAVVCQGQSTANLSGTQLSAAGAGTGGASLGSSGADGLATMSYNCGIF